MIRRGLWLTAGAVTGIYGYRRVSAVGRRLSATLTPGRLTPGTLAPEGTLEIALTRETYRFTRDVREGMELYRLAHPAPAGSALSADRTLPANQDRPTDHEPEDGH
jgi:hypothetical protein